MLGIQSNLHFKCIPLSFAQFLLYNTGWKRPVFLMYPFLLPSSFTSSSPFDELESPSATPRSTSPTSTRSSSSAVPPVSPVSSDSSPTSSTARNPTRASSPTRPSPTVPLSRPLSSLVTPLRRPRTSSMSPLSPSVSRPPAVSWPPHQAAAPP